MIGKKILHYTILEQLGAGGMGVVYKAEDTRLGRTVALKFLPPGVVGTADDRARLMSEARAAAALVHPGICTIFGIEESDGQLFIVMQYLEGQLLEDRIALAPLSVEESTAHIKALAEGLRVAHAAGVIHRDIKSANIVLGRSGPVLLDFGLAKSTSGTAITQIGTAVGTPQCMSPEQARGEHVDQRTDIWALGIVWYEMLTGRVPFLGDFASAVIYSILNEDPKPPSSLRAGVPADVERTILKMLAKDPAGRHRDVDALLADIAAFGGPTASTVRAAEKSPTSIAVLPFENMSADPEQEYFCDGIAEDVINDLTRIDGLQVAARTTSFAYKGRREDIRKVGREIGVGTVLEGSVRKAGNRVRVTAQLINVSDGYHMWSERYDRDLEDVFAIQEEIARNIVDALRVELSEEEDRELATHDTRDVEAYDLYLRGRENLLRLTMKESHIAYGYFEQAIARDPGFARAYAGRAAYFVMTHQYYKNEPGMLEKAMESAERAIELDPNLAEAHAALGYALSAIERYDDAEREFERALEIHPGLFEAHYYRGRSNFARGDLDRAVASFQRAATVDPSDFQAWALLASLHDGAGRKELAELAATLSVERSKQHLEHYPGNARAAYLCSGSLVILGRNDEALEYLEIATTSAPDDPGVLYNVACLNSQIGRLDEAIDALNKTIDAGFSQKVWIENDPDLDAIRTHPRYAETMKRLD